MSVLSALAPCTLELSLEPDEYAEALYLALGRTLGVRRTLEAGHVPKVWEIRNAIKAVLAEHGTRGVKKWYAKATDDAKVLDSIQPDEGHWRDHVSTQQWCHEQVERSFRPRAPRRRKAEPALLMDVPLW